MDIKQNHRVGRLDLLAWRVAVAPTMDCDRWQRYAEAYRVTSKIKAGKIDGSMAAVHRTAADSVAWLAPQVATSFRRAARTIERHASTPTASPPPIAE